MESIRKLVSNPLVLACSAVAISAYIYQNYENPQIEEYLASIRESIESYSATWSLAESEPQDEATLGLTVPEIIDSYEDFSCEIHKVHTKDGYILELHRIVYQPASKNTPNAQAAGDQPPPAKFQTKRPVLLQHGILADSSNWVLNGPDQDSLGFALALNGNDVWLSNSRGNTYSKKHERYDSTENSEFWEFTWFEMSDIDLPTMVDYILEVNDNYHTLDFIGHSQGTLIMLVALDRHPEFRHKINNFHALAPISVMSHMKSPLKYLAETTYFERIIYRKWPMEILSSANNFTTAWLHDKFGGLSGERDVPILTALVGLNPRRYHINKMKTYLSHFTSGTSIQNIMHFAQMIKHKAITRFIDENSSEKIKNAQKFTLSRIRQVKFFLYVGDDDIFSDVEDVEVLQKLLVRQENQVELIKIDDFDHLSFLWGKRVFEECYSKVLERQG